MDKILIFIPMYNCEKQIPRVIAQITGKVLSYITEILVIDNGSPDNSINAALQAIQYCTVKAKVVQNVDNYSLGGSHKVAFQYAIENGFDYLIVLHGDDQGSINDIVPILESKMYRNADMTLGSRFMKGSKLPGYSKFRIFGNIVYNLLFSIVLFRPISDLGSGLNMYRAASLKGAWWYKLPDKLSFNYTMLMAASYLKQKIRFFPISWQEEDQVSNVKIMRQAVEMAGMLVKYFFLRGRYIKSELRQIIVEKYEYRTIGENQC
ncbi:hypothetical protein FACS1894190_11940 [Spirochaetia bacterium]|nr:hypothetical protein FACS1894190_11940 [Spirochaetia bacterium]